MPEVNVMARLLVYEKLWGITAIEIVNDLYTGHNGSLWGCLDTVHVLCYNLQVMEEVGDTLVTQ